MDNDMTDAELQQAVETELNRNSRIGEPNIHIEVHGGVVTLRGTVSCWGKRQAAQQAVHRVSGVLDVANETEVRAPVAPGLSDTEVAHAVRHALTWDVFVPEDRITSTVSHGWVRLEGNVDDWNQRIDAEKAISNLMGVRGVVNSIEVKPCAVPNDVHHAIQQAFAHRAERDAARVNVEVFDGVVTLRGSVRSNSEKELVIRAAHECSNIRTVEDHLNLEPFVN